MATSMPRVLRTVGFAMQTRHAVLSNLSVLDKPDATWEYERLERLHGWLFDHFELDHRHVALSRKLDFLAENNRLIMDVLANRKSLRLEWAIVILIAVEILMFGLQEVLK